MRSRISVQGPAIWTGSGTSHIHEMYECRAFPFETWDYFDEWLFIAQSHDVLESQSESFLLVQCASACLWTCRTARTSPPSPSHSWERFWIRGLWSCLLTESIQALLNVLVKLVHPLENVAETPKTRGSSSLRLPPRPAVYETIAALAEEVCPTERVESWKNVCCGNTGMFWSGV